MRKFLLAGVAGTALLTAAGHHGRADQKPLAFNLTSTSCKTMGSLPGRTAEPVIKAGLGFEGSCRTRGPEVLCAMRSQLEGTKDAYTKTPLWTVKFHVAAVEGKYVLMISDDGLNHLLLNLDAERFSWAQTSTMLVDDGLTMQKQCLGDWESIRAPERAPR
jgi:hypothetical protein